MALKVKNSPANAGNMRSGFVPGLGRFPGEGNGNSLQYSCWENPMDRGAWWAMIHRVAESDTTEATFHAFMMLENVLISFFYMQLSSFPRTTY